jgi:hypothetical protein
MLRMHAPPGDHDLIITNGNNQTIEVQPLAWSLLQLLV